MSSSNCGDCADYESLYPAALKSIAELESRLALTTKALDFIANGYLDCQFCRPDSEVVCSSHLDNVRNCAKKALNELEKK